MQNGSAEFQCGIFHEIRSQRELVIDVTFELDRCGCFYEYDIIIIIFFPPFFDKLVQKPKEFAFSMLAYA